MMKINLYSLDHQWHNNDDNKKVHNTLLYIIDNDENQKRGFTYVCHIIYVIDAEKLTKLMFCDKCGSLVVYTRL